MQFSAMASDCTLHLVGLAPRDAQHLAQRAIAEVRRIETTYSRYRADSVVSRINAAAGSGRPVEVDAETLHLLGFAGQLHAASAGLFDLTSGVLRRVWDFKAGRLPDAAALARLLPLVGWGQVQVQVQQHRAGTPAQAGTVLLPRAGMELDFGGIGKEYAADRAASLLQQLGLRAGLVNLGGDIRLLGPRPCGTPWALGIAHPRQPGTVLATLALQDGALATSGDYERFFVSGGQRHCHLLNPFTGQSSSAQAGAWQSISVLAPACLAAGALSTVAMLKGADALGFLQQQQVAYLAVDSQGQVHRSAVHTAAASTVADQPAPMSGPTSPCTHPLP